MPFVFQKSFSLCPHRLHRLSPGATTAAQLGHRYRTTVPQLPQASMSAPTGLPHVGHGITSCLPHLLHTVQSAAIGARQYGQTAWCGWARAQNGQKAEFSSTSFPQNRHGFL